MRTMQKKSDAEMTVREYLSMRRGLILSMRGQPADALWVLVSQLKYHSAYPYEMIEDAERIVRNERQKAATDTAAAPSQSV